MLSFNCTIKGNSCFTKNDWGYFGCCDNTLSLEQFVAKANSQGDENDWGGSFDSKKYTNWFHELGTTSKLVTGDGGYNVIYTRSTSNNPNTSQVINRLRDGAYLPLKFEDESKQRASISNTGYLVGSNVGTGVNASPKISSYRLVNIGNALSNTSYTNMSKTYSSDTSNIVYDDSKLEVLTYHNGWVRIKDSHNSNNNTTNALIRGYNKVDVSTLGFQKYENSRNALQETLSDSSQIHGIHFDNNQVSKTNLLTIPTNVARVNGQKYSTTYQVPKGSINFSLKKDGLINFFAGTYNTSNIDLNFFSLHEVFRNGGTIIDIKEINQIYKNNGEGNPYVYKYSNNTYSNGTRGDLIFDVANILKETIPVKNMLYYFELPVNSGEFAMGVAGSTQGAYMIYLDLGANAGQEPIGIDDFGSIEYRTAPEVTTNSLLLITYELSDEESITIKVSYVDNSYFINIESSNSIKVLITTLTLDYFYYINNELLPSGIMIHEIYT